MRQLDELKAVAETLGSTRDIARESIDMASDALAKLKIGVKAQVRLHERAVLAFDRKGDVWGLYILAKTKDGKDVKVPLSDASLDDLCAAAAHLDALFTELLVQAKAELARIRHANELVAEFIARRT